MDAAAIKQLGRERGLEGFGLISKNDRNALLRGAGVSEVQMGEAVASFKAGFAEGQAEERVIAADRERQRVAPFMAAARESCGPDADEAELAAVAAEMADEDQRERDEAEAEKQRAAEAVSEQKQLQAVRCATLDQIVAHCLGLGLDLLANDDIINPDCSGGSTYVFVRGLKVRISDHAQPVGGGFSHERAAEHFGDGQHGEADISIDPTTEWTAADAIRMIDEAEEEDE